MGKNRIFWVFFMRNTNILLAHVVGQNNVWRWCQVSWYSLSEGKSLRKVKNKNYSEWPNILADVAERRSESVWAAGT